MKFAYKLHLTKLWRKAKQHYVFTLPVAFFIVLMAIWAINPFGITYCFFGNDVKPEKILTYIGAICGGIILFLQLNENSKRNRNMEHTNTIAERGQVNTRFKDAATLLGSEQTASILSGIYALHQIAVEAANHKNKEQQGYVKVINDILCAYVRESAKNTTEQNNIGLAAKPQRPTVKKRVCTRPTVVLQTIVDVLFKNEGDIYGKYESDLSGAVFENISFIYATINNARFDDATLTDTKFNLATLNDTWFNDATLSGILFNSATLTHTAFNEATLTGTYFNHATLTKTEFCGAILTDTRFCSAKLKSTWFNYTVLKNINFSKSFLSEKETTLESVDFDGTVLEGYSYEDIIARSMELTK